MEAQFQTVSTGEPLLVKSFSNDSDKLFKGGVSSGNLQEFFVKRKICIKKMCKYGGNVIFAYIGRDGKSGGVIVFDPVTTKLVQSIDTLAAVSCRVDGEYLVVGGWENGLVTVFKHDGSQFILVSKNQLHGSSRVDGVAIHAAAGKIVSVGYDEKATISNFAGSVEGQVTLPSSGLSVVIHNTLSIAFAGCWDGSVSMIDIEKSTIISTTQAHIGIGMLSVDICPERNILVSGACDHLINGWKVDKTSMTKLWSLKCHSFVTSLCIYSDRAFINERFCGVVALDLNRGRIDQVYKIPGDYYSWGIVVVDTQGAQGQTLKAAHVDAQAPNSKGCAAWTVQEVKQWMEAQSLPLAIQSALDGMTGTELCLLSDPEAFTELGLTKLQANRLKTVLAELNIHVNSV